MRIGPTTPPPANDSTIAPSRSQFVPVTEARPESAPRSTHRHPRQHVEPAGEPRFSVLNDFRYLTESDKTMLSAVTGQAIEPAFMDRPGSANAFALQLALDRRTGQLAPNQQVTSVYLRNASEELAARNAGRSGYTNPYSGQTFEAAVAWLDSHGASRADIRL